MSSYDRFLTIFYTAIALATVMFGISGWQSYGAPFWNWTHTAAFTFLPLLGFAMLIGIYKRLTDDED